MAPTAFTKKKKKRTNRRFGRYRNAYAARSARQVGAHLPGDAADARRQGVVFNAKGDGFPVTPESAVRGRVTAVQARETRTAAEIISRATGSK